MSNRASLSPELELAVQMIAEGQTIPCHVCSALPTSVHDVVRLSLGRGNITAEGGTVTMNKTGIAVCLAYQVGTQLVLSTTEAMPIKVNKGQRAHVRALTLK